MAFPAKYSALNELQLTEEARRTLARIIRVAGGQQGTVATSMALRRGDVADPAVTVLMVVPMYERGRPLPRCGEVSKARCREVRAVLGGAE